MSAVVGRKPGEGGNGELFEGVLAEFGGQKAIFGGRAQLDQAHAQPVRFKGWFGFRFDLFQLSQHVPGFGDDLIYRFVALIQIPIQGFGAGKNETQGAGLPHGEDAQFAGVLVAGLTAAFAFGGRFDFVWGRRGFAGEGCRGGRGHGWVPVDLKI